MEIVAKLVYRARVNRKRQHRVVRAIGAVSDCRSTQPSAFAWWYYVATTNEQKTTTILQASRALML